MTFVRRGFLPAIPAFALLIAGLPGSWTPSAAQDTTAQDTAEAKKKADETSAESAATKPDDAPDAKEATVEIKPVDEKEREKSAETAKPEDQKDKSQSAEAEKPDTGNDAEKSDATAETKPADDTANDNPAETAKSEDDASRKDESQTADTDKPDTGNDAEKNEATAETKPAEDGANDDAAETAKSDDDTNENAAETAKSDEDAGKEDDKTDTAATSEDNAQSDTGDDAEKTADKPDDSAAEETAAAPESVDVPKADPLIIAVREHFADPEFAKSTNEADRAAATAFYQARSDAPLWVSGSSFTSAADTMIAEIKKADTWGLDASKYTLPELSGGATEADVSKAEAELTLAALQYAREARGGRINPQVINTTFDQTAPVKEPKVVLADLAKSSDAAAYLRDLHPKNYQFLRLKKVLADLRTKAKGPEPDVDEALLVKIPAGRVISPGTNDPVVALLRKRLKVEASGETETLYDETLVEAVKEFQREAGEKPDGYVGRRTRAAMNGEAIDQPNFERDIQLVLNNMERWRWLPKELGSFYVWNNVPEFKTRAVKDDKRVYEERIVVGLPNWKTPAFSARMRTVVFNPTWGVPDGIKMKELRPQLRRASGYGGGGLFDELFGGGYGGASDVLRRHDLKVTYRGRPVNPNSVDWNSVDIRRFQFTQPSGPRNVLGRVKFLFHNKHDVYLHDTTAKHLFAKSKRTYSHGCMRLKDPDRFAELLLAEDKGWSENQVQSRFAGGNLNEVKIDKTIWVHTTYFTAVVDDDGKLNKFADVYGYESRMTEALSGKKMNFYVPPAVADAGQTSNRSRQRPRKRKKQYTQDPLAEAISGLFAN